MTISSLVILGFGFILILDATRPGAADKHPAPGTTARVSATTSIRDYGRCSSVTGAAESHVRARLRQSC